MFQTLHGLQVCHRRISIHLHPQKTEGQWLGPDSEYNNVRGCDESPLEYSHSNASDSDEHMSEEKDTSKTFTEPGHEDPENDGFNT